MSEQTLGRRLPANKGMPYPADPPSVEEIVAVMRSTSNGESRVVVYPGPQSDVTCERSRRDGPPSQ